MPESTGFVPDINPQRETVLKLLYHYLPFLYIPLPGESALQDQEIPFTPTFRRISSEYILTKDIYSLLEGLVKNQKLNEAFYYSPNLIAQCWDLINSILTWRYYLRRHMAMFEQQAYLRGYHPIEWNEDGNVMEALARVSINLDMLFLTFLEQRDGVIRVKDQRNMDPSTIPYRCYRWLIEAYRGCLWLCAGSRRYARRYAIDIDCFADSLMPARFAAECIQFTSMHNPSVITMLENSPSDIKLTDFNTFGQCQPDNDHFWLAVIYHFLKRVLPTVGAYHSSGQPYPERQSQESEDGEENCHDQSSSDHSDSTASGTSSTTSSTAGSDVEILDSALLGFEPRYTRAIHCAVSALLLEPSNAEYIERKMSAWQALLKFLPIYFRIHVALRHGALVLHQRLRLLSRHLDSEHLSPVEEPYGIWMDRLHKFEALGSRNTIAPWLFEKNENGIVSRIKQGRRAWTLLGIAMGHTLRCMFIVKEAQKRCAWMLGSNNSFSPQEVFAAFKQLQAFAKSGSPSSVGSRTNRPWWRASNI
ncbi:hypothetical protein GGR57DRAFT_508929 [Xylariaceae sp. FL1272]|nr:hypothetical protein GGR57DRAFT_508929 [Xylariaceae sp. FL1272]